MRYLFAVGTILALSTCVVGSDISSLIDDLGTKSKGRNASEALARIGKPAIPALIDALKDRDRHRGRYAARALRQMGQEAAEAIPALSEALGDADADTREYAVEALGRMTQQAETVIPMLKKATSDKNKRVREKAVLILKRLKASEPSHRGETPKAIDRQLDLKSGICGFPFGGTIEDVVSWCAENHVNIKNPTERDVKRDAAKALAEVDGLEDAYESEMRRFTPVEKQLLNLDQIDSEVRDNFEDSRNAAVQEKLAILNNPSIEYDGQMLYMERSEGIRVQMDGQSRICSDPRVFAYELRIEPTEKSQAMDAIGLSSMSAILYSQANGELLTYGTIASISENGDRDTAVQFDLVVSSLTEKYGQPCLVPSGSRKIARTEMRRVLHASDGSLLAYLIKQPMLAWGRNLVLIGDIVSTPSGLRLQQDVLVLIHYEHSAACQMTEIHKEAIEDFKKEYYKNKEAAFAQMKQNF